MRATSHDLLITGGTVLLAVDGPQPTHLVLRGGLIDRIGGGVVGGDAFSAAGPCLRLDAAGLLVLPGIVDLHGDAFERQFQPRPGVEFPADLALRDTEAQLLANGITTAFHGITLSWEPGLRGPAAWRAVLDALSVGDWTCDMRVHLRWEAYNLDALDIAIGDIEAGRVHLLAFNDHTPAILRDIRDPVAGARYSDRSGLDIDAFRALANRVAAGAGRVEGTIERIAAAARAAGLPMASHDDASIPSREMFRALGARICEFPMAEAVGQAAAVAGDYVAMGCPNVVRGGSHLGWASATRLAESGICTVLTSDYFYPAMSRGALILANRGTLSLSAAWALISTNPAAAAGLTDRGTIEVGKRADIVLVEPAAAGVIATVAAGQIAYLTAAGSRRLSACGGGLD